MKTELARRKRGRSEDAEPAEAAPSPRITSGGGKLIFTSTANQTDEGQNAPANMKPKTRCKQCTTRGFEDSRSREGRGGPPGRWVAGGLQSTWRGIA